MECWQTNNAEAENAAAERILSPDFCPCDGLVDISLNYSLKTQGFLSRFQHVRFCMAEASLSDRSLAWVAGFTCLTGDHHDSGKT